MVDPMYTRVTYQKERLGLRRWIDPSLYGLEEMKSELKRAAERGGHIIVRPETWDVDVQTTIKVLDVPVYFGHVYIGVKTIHIRYDMATTVTWVWKDVRPEHRDRLAGMYISKDHTVDMISMEPYWGALA